MKKYDDITANQLGDDCFGAIKIRRYPSWVKRQDQKSTVRDDDLERSTTFTKKGAIKAYLKNSEQ